MSRRLICDDVRAAIHARRGGRALPSAFRSALPHEENRIYVWTPRLERIYIVEGVRRPQRAWLQVVTALPGFCVDGDVADLDWRAAA